MPESSGSGIFCGHPTLLIVAAGGAGPLEIRSNLSSTSLGEDVRWHRPSLGGPCFSTGRTTSPKEVIVTTSLGEIVTLIGYHCAQLSLRLRQLHPIDVPWFSHGWVE